MRSFMEVPYRLWFRFSTLASSKLRRRRPAEREHHSFPIGQVIDFQS
jgi:hypothetical protein